MLAYATLKCRWLFIFLLCTGFFSKAQVNANFSATPLSGCTPLVVTFTDLSTGYPTSWKWDLGNGTISFLQNPSVTYFTPGQYNVKLIARNAAGVDSLVKNQFITVQASPAVSFLADPLTGCYPLPVHFNDLSTAGSGSIIKREWDFGDGNISDVQNPQHVYGAAGNFNVSVRITNSAGCATTLTKPQYIQINTGVKAGFTNNTPNSCNPPVTINFINQSTGTGVLNYQWDLGDGTVSNAPAPSHTYISNGSYTVRLIVKNSTGCADTLIKANAITLGLVQANISLPAVMCKETPIHLVNLSSPAPAGALWDFGDGTFSDSISPVKIYSSAGNYVVKMVANFGACKDSVSRSVTVLEKPSINFTADKTISCNAPFSVKFTNTSIGATAYTWEFGDGTFSSVANPVHIYGSPGIYPVTLIATNAAGCSDSLVKSGYIKIQLPVVEIANLPKKGCAPFFADFSSTVQSVDPISTYQWNFGDGTTGSGPTPSHVFVNPGSYTIQLVVTTQGGCKDTTIFAGGVVVGTKPKANLSADQQDVCASVNINFKDLSTGTTDKWLWEFGDGGTSSDQNPGHTYEDTGYFDVTLIAWNGGCADTVVIKKYIHINPPVALFTVKYDCVNPFQKEFTDQSIGADTWEWDFGDQTTSNAQSPVHSYSAPGNYLVKLKVTNKTTGCAYTKTEMVPVIADKADFTASATSVCKGNSITFQTQNIIPANIADYHWNFGDGAATSGILPKIDRTYTTAGNYSVTLIITNVLGCTDTLTKPLSAEIDGPTANFSTLQPGTCINNSITFLDSSHGDGSHSIQSWTWNYGDGIQETLTTSPFQHVYTATGTYNVSLKVVDDKGCADSILKTNSVLITKPVALFYSPDSLSCSDKPIRFSNGSSGLGVSYLWHFGDGTTATAGDPVHQYANQGLYSVSLTATDKFGCIDSFERIKYINVSNPIANFLMSDSVSTCPPLVVSFTNTSINTIDRFWDFGDGTSSVLNDPTHFYSTPGVFTVVLKVTGPGGCTDELSKKITVNGPTGSFTYTNIIGCNPLQTSFKGSTKRNISFVWDFADGTTIATRDSVIKHTYTNPGNYLPKMILVDINGCQVPITGVDTIRVFGVSANFKTSQAILCDSGSVNFMDSSTSNDLVSSYLWNFGDGSTSVQKDPVHIYQSTGSYLTTLVVTSQFGCKDTTRSSTPVKIVASPKFEIAGGANACIPASENFSGRLLGTDTSALSWKWDMDNGNIYTQKIPPVQHYGSANTYHIQLTVTNSSGCTNTVTKNIEVYPLPQIETIADSWVCKGKPIQLSVSGAAAYNWSPSMGLSCINCANPVAAPDSAITYTVTGTSSYGCMSKDSVRLSVKYPFKMQVGANTSVCSGSSTQLVASGTDRYNWSPAAGLNNSLIAAPKASPSESTNYRVIGTDDIGCFSDTGYVAVKVYPVPTVNAGEDKTINVGQSIDLIPEISPDVTGVNWSPTSGIFRNNYPGISARPVQSTEYTVEVVNEGGCMARDLVTVYVLCNNANVFIPNTFSPNGDGVNEVFYPRGTGLFTIKAMRIFNRWGELVFEKGNMKPNDPSAGWDGTCKGQKLTPDVFVYLVDVICDNNTVLTYKGNIALIK